MKIEAIKDIKEDAVDISVEFDTDDERIRFDESLAVIVAIANHYNDITSSGTGGAQMLQLALEQISKEA